MRVLRSLLWTSLCVALTAVGPAVADGTGDIKKAMKEKSKGTHYLKTNAPYLQGRHAYGTFKRSVVTVSPKGGVKIGGSAEVSASAWHAEGRRLSLRVNDPVVVDEFEWDSEDKSLEIELEGTGRAEDGDGVIKFVNLNSVADLQKCWNAAFSKVSIETKYDWPADIKQAVVNREVRPGMNREQVMVAVGGAEKVSRSTDGGRQVETWLIQRGEGAKMGFWSMKTGDKQELEIRFVDGRVTQIGGGAEQPTVKLK